MEDGSHPYHNQKKLKMTELPFSLIASEILSTRLPSKSDIGRCRCVCKQWKSFLSTPSFNRMHLQYHRSINDYKLLLFDPQLPHPFRTLTLNDHGGSNPNLKPNPNPVLSIVASLDGLVCLVSRNVPSKQVLWNPLTGAYKKLPSIPLTGNVFATDPMGFYTDDSCNDYRLLCLVAGGQLGAYVYSLRLDSWRRIGSSFCSYLDPCDWSPATFYGQGLYFIVECLLKLDNRSWIVCFDVKTETFRKITFPPLPNGATEYSGSLVVLNDCLHLRVSYKIYNAEYYRDSLKYGDLWRMDSYGEFVKVGAFSDSIYRSFTMEQRICSSSTGNWVAVLDQDNNSFRKMSTEDFTRYYHYISAATWEYRSSRMIFVETLISPNL